MEKANKSSAILKTILLGCVSATLYFLLYYFEGPILNWSQQGNWYLLVPVSIAVIFSFVHGSFTNYFWDVLGVKAKPIKR